LAKKDQRTIPVHALGDERIHLARPHHGRLRQGRLKTLCGKQAVSELPLFAAIEAKGNSRCRTCFGKVDEHGYLKEVETVRAVKAKASDVKPGGKLIPLSARKNSGGRESD
jgi:hypothetical protein